MAQKIHIQANIQALVRRIEHMELMIRELWDVVDELGGFQGDHMGYSMRLIAQLNQLTQDDLLPPSYPEN